MVHFQFTEEIAGGKELRKYSFPTEHRKYARPSLYLFFP